MGSNGRQSLLQKTLVACYVLAAWLDVGSSIVNKLHNSNWDTA
jgi:hypothetical protein